MKGSLVETLLYELGKIYFIRVFISFKKLSTYRKKMLLCREEWALQLALVSLKLILIIILLTNIYYMEHFIEI